LSSNFASFLEILAQVRQARRMLKRTGGGLKMVTLMRRALGIVALAGLCGCLGNVVTTGETETEEGGQLPPAPQLSYPGKGFIVHEWGTDTVVVGSDGSLQVGLHHEEEDLPAFVYGRIAAGSLEGSQSVHVKMETPVTYFYSDEPRTVAVNVAFPAGVLTQWYPAVASFYPFVAAANAVPGLLTAGDPALDIGFPFSSQACADNHGKAANGLLDWGKVEVLGRGVGAEVPEASLEKYTWSHAREVDANLVRVSGVPGAMTAAQNEKFLFYRGVGNFDLPVKVTASAKAGLRAQNMVGDPIGEVFFLNVTDESGAFEHHVEGIVPGNGVGSPTILHSPEGAEPIDAFVESLGEAVTGALDRAGLYHDEATAMVRTWKRQWFRTPGVRVLYLAPQSWTDASIPLSIEPKPESTVRVMMMRVEVLTPDLEGQDYQMLNKLLEPEPKVAEVVDYFSALGRFGEPRLRRALSGIYDPTVGDPVLAVIASSKTAVTTGE
jgi:hypothetical protein